MSRLFCCLLLLIQPFLVDGQSDTLFQYDVRMQQWQAMPEVPTDSLPVFDSTSSYSGSFGNVVLMPQLPPATNLFPGSCFSDLALAASFFPVTSYPARTAIKLFGYKNDTVRHNCSGIMVGDRFVLTAAHCLVTFKVWTSDSLLAVPAYDMGHFQPALPYSMVEKYYFFSSWYHSFQHDIALLQLREPIGQQVGWVGMAFNRDDQFFQGKVYHKFSYPAAASLIDTNRKYNGDTLYYNYGLIESGINGFLFVPGSQTVGVPGQSGSSLLYTDNEVYYTVGVMNFASQYKHFRISPYVFNQFRSVIDQYAGFGLPEPPRQPQLMVFPNPFSESALVQLNDPEFPEAGIRLFNAAGKLVKEQKLGKDGKTVLMRTDLTAGLYYLYLFFSGRLMAGKKVIVF